MPATLVEIHRDRFDPARLRVLPIDDRLLVIDRVSGRWVYLDASDLAVLELLATEPADLPDGVRASVQDMRKMLLADGVGERRSEKRFADLTTLIVKVTSACNLACTYCYDYDSEEYGTRLDPELGVEAIRQALDLAPNGLWVILHGGEPMLAWPTIEHLVLEAEREAVTRGKRIRFTGQTNLTRLTTRIVEFSVAHDIAWGVSLDGPKEVHDHARVRHRGEGSYDTMMDAVRRFPRFVRSCGVMSTITNTNQHLLAEIAVHVRQLGFTTWDWSLFQPVGRASGEPADFEIDTPTLLDSWDRLFDAVVRGDFDGFAVLPVKKYIDNFISGPGANMCMRGECGAARDLLSLSADGTIEACDCIDPKGPLSSLGNLHTGTLEQARMSPRADAIRSRSVGTTACSDCLWYGVCGGTCLAHAGAVDAVWGLGCELSKLAFDRISSSLARDDTVTRYLQSLQAP